MQWFDSNSTVWLSLDKNWVPDYDPGDLRLKQKIDSF
jgi:hypothetical protein